MKRKPKHLGGVPIKQYHKMFNRLYKRILLIIGGQPVAVIGPLLVELHAWLLAEIPDKDREDMLKKHTEWVRQALKNEQS